MRPKHFLLQPEKIFLVLALFFGFIYLILSPPFQVPDTPNHFLRAYQISEGGFIPEKLDNRVGGFLPVSLKKLEIIYHPVIAGRKFLKESIFERSARVPLNKDSRAFIDFNNTGLYAPFCYLPQACAIFVLRFFSVSPLVILYASSAFALITWSLLIFISIKLMPFGKWLICFVCLLPTSIHINGSLSADSMTNGIAFLLLALLLNSAYRKELVSEKRVGFICIVLFILPLVKPIFICLLLLILIIPPKKFGSTKRWIRSLALFIIAALIPFILWSKIIQSYYLSYEEYNPNYRVGAALIKGVDANKQLAFVKEHRVVLLRVVKNSFKKMPEYHVPGYIATFGWISLVPPDWFIYGMYFCIILVTFFERDFGIKIPWHVTLIFILTFVASLSSIFIGLFLTWQGVKGEQCVTFFQGRYLAPIYPLVFLSINAMWPLKKSVLPFFVIIISVFSLSYCSYLLYQWYY